MKNSFRFTITLPDWTVPIALFILIYFSFGLLIPSLGFYWDDYPSIWFNHIWGTSVFPQVFSSDRPFLGRLFMLTMPLFRDDPIKWQFFAIITRWLTSFAFWWAFTGLWKEKTNSITLAAFLFAVYPGFGQQWIAVTYSHVFLGYAAFLFSLGCMIYALKFQRWTILLSFLALVLSSFSLFTAEYFAGMELLRPIIIFIILRNLYPNRKFIQQAILVITYWLPYIILFALFLTWRFVLHAFPRAQMQLFTQIQNEPFLVITQILRSMVQNILEASIGAWSQVFQITKLLDFSNDLSSKAFLLALLSGIAIASYIFSLIQEKKPPLPSENPDHMRYKLETTQMLLFGFTSMLFAGIPAWVMNLPIHLSFPADRFILSMSLGASLVIAGGIEILTVSPWKKACVVGILLGLAVGYHYLSADQYKKEWDAQRTFFWELVWRAPAIEPNTVLITRDLPFKYYTDNSLSAPLNWIYTPKDQTHRLQYLIYDTALGTNKEDNILSNASINEEYRSFIFSGNSSAALLIYWDRLACLQVLESQYDSNRYNFPDSLYKLLTYSKSQRIITNPLQSAQPPAEVFGTEPKHSWCYFYQKASLARQQNDWEEIVNLAQEAQEKGYLPMLPAIHAHEYLPFIEGYARLGYWAKARNFSRNAYTQSSHTLRNSLCSLWTDISQLDKTDPEVQKEIRLIQSDLNCNYPRGDRP